MKSRLVTKTVSLLLVMAVMALSAGAAFADDDLLFCRKCGRQIPADSNFCPYCGEAVISLPAAAEAEPESEDTSVTDAIIAELIASIRTMAETNAASAPAPAAAEESAAAPEPIPGPFYTTVGGASSGAMPAVTVTKSPTSESVPYGGAAIFIARADYDTSITWYIANSDASVIYNVSDAPRYISGLVVYGQGTETLTLCEIPSWMNGWQVQACFTGEGGPVYSGVANIWTYQLAQPVYYYEPVYCEPAWCDWGCYPPCPDWCSWPPPCPAP